MISNPFLCKLKVVGLLLAGMLLFSCSDRQSDGQRPNIILIIADDMGFSDLGCYGSEISTPNLDQLAMEGIRFTQFHNTSKCFPSRACLLTGVYAQQCGMDEHAGYLEHAATLGEVLRSAGYRTLAVGKHHGIENLYDRGFDRYFGLKDGTCNYWNPGVQREGEPVPAHKTWAKPRKWAIDDSVYAPYTPPQKDFYTTDYFTNYAIDYLEQYHAEDRPFFLYAAYNAPHDPLQAWPEDIEKYLGSYMAGYEVIRNARYRRQLESGLLDETFPLSDPACQDWESLSEEEKITADSLMATYAAMIDRLDQNIGRLVEKLKELKEYDNTIIMFMSDNGAQPRGPGDDQLNQTARSYPIGSIGRYASLNESWANVSNTPFRYYKNWSHQGGICTPFIIHWPAGMKEFEKGIIHFPAHFIDIMPTLVEIAGAVYPERIDDMQVTPYEGTSLVEVWKGKQARREHPIFWQWNKGKGVRSANYKLVSGNNGPWELYDMSLDKSETRNLAELFPEKVIELDSIYQEWIADVKRSGE